ncbi:MAG: hypothetical protein ACYC1Q_01735 [Bacteroidia bacterium]
MNQKMLEGEFSAYNKESAFERLKTLTLIPFTKNAPLPSEIDSLVHTDVSPNRENVNIPNSGFILANFPPHNSLAQSRVKEATERNFSFTLLLTGLVHFVERFFSQRLVFPKEHS